jgi:putative endonuclease
MAKTRKLMHYTYVLKSLKDSLLYIGSTDNLKRRFTEHSEGRVRSTKCRKPLKLIFYEAFSNKEDSVRREKYFKTTKGKTTLKIMLRESLK